MEEGGKLMSADLHLFATPDTPEVDAAWQKLCQVDMIGGDEDWVVQPATPEYREKYGRDSIITAGSRYHDELISILYGERWVGPNVWIGQVSWLKAGLLGEQERFIPACVRRIQQLTAEGPILTPGLAKEITVAMNLPNHSIYGRVEYTRRTEDHFYGGNGPIVHRYGIQKTKTRGVARAGDVKRFLAEHRGKRIFSDSL